MGNYNTKLGLYISWPFIVAVFLFGINLLFYAQAIKKIPLYIAYPFVVGITIIMITLFSSFFYQDKIQMREISAVAFILVGITILSK
jgi:multidrug transporter EmrE-like cation transporter